MKKRTPEQILNSVLASQVAEGIQPSPEAQEICLKMLNKEISSEETIRLSKGLHLGKGEK